MAKLRKGVYRRRPIEEIDDFLRDRGLSVEGTESERRVRAKNKRRNESPSGKRSAVKYQKSPAGQETKRRYKATEGARKQAAEYRSRPEVLEREAASKRAKRLATRSKEPTGKLGKLAVRLHETAKTPRYEILAVKASELARPHHVTAESYQKAVKWFDGLDEKTRVDLEGKFARRRGAVDKRIIAFLKRAKVSEDDIAKFLSGGIEYHHFDEVMLGTKSADKFFSGAYIDNHLHDLIHKNISSRLQGLLKSGDATRPSRLGPLRGLLHHTSEIQNYNPFRKGTIPPYLRIVAEKSFGKRSAKKMLDEALYVATGEGAPSNLAGERVRKNFKPSKDVQRFINKGFSLSPWALPAAVVGGGLVALSPKDSIASMVGEGLVGASDPLTMVLSGPSKTRNPNYMGLLSEQERRMIDPTWEADTAINTPPKKKRENIWT